MSTNDGVNPRLSDACHESEISINNCSDAADHIPRPRNAPGRSIVADMIPATLAPASIPDRIASAKIDAMRLRFDFILGGNGSSKNYLIFIFTKYY
jgi:hypothetical protein